MDTPGGLTGALRSIWVVVIYLFFILLIVQFYLAGHGAFEFHNSTASGRDAGWDAHRALGDLLLLLSLLQLLLALGARLPRPLLGQAIGLFVLLVLQFLLAQWGDSTSTRPIAALHAVNALLIIGDVVGMLSSSRPFSPIRAFRPAAASGAAGAGQAG